MAPMQPDNLRQTAVAIDEVRRGRPRDHLGQHHVECCNEAADELDSLRREVPQLRRSRDLLGMLSRLEAYREVVGEDDFYRARHREVMSVANALLRALDEGLAGSAASAGPEALTQIEHGSEGARCGSPALHALMTAPLEAGAGVGR